MCEPASPAFVIFCVLFVLAVIGPALYKGIKNMCKRKKEEN